MGPMLVLASSLYQFCVTNGHLSSLNCLLVSLFSLCICSHQSLILVTLCVSQVVHYILGFASQVFHYTIVVFCFCPLFLSPALHYTLVFAFVLFDLSLQYPIQMFAFLFYIFIFCIFDSLYLTFIYGYFRVKMYSFHYFRFKIYSCQFLNVNVFIFIQIISIH